MPNSHIEYECENTLTHISYHLRSICKKLEKKKFSEVEVQVDEVEVAVAVVVAVVRPKHVYIV